MRAITEQQKQEAIAAFAYEGTSKMENIKSADHLTLQQRKVQIMKWQKTSSLIS